MARTEKIKVILYGVGAMGRMTAGLMIEKGMDIVAAIDKYSHVGEDLGDVLELGHKMGVTVSDDPEKVLANTKADIVSVCAKSLIKDMQPIFVECLSHGFNVVSLAEEPFYPWRTKPEESAAMDAVAKKHGVTLTSTGIQDVMWLNLFCTLSACAVRIDKVIGRAVSDNNEYGEEATKSIGIGLTVEQFEERSRTQQVDPSWFGMTLEAIVSRLELKPVSIRDWVEPIVCDHDIYYKAADKDIKAGLVTGWRQISEIETENGPTFRAEFDSKICDTGEKECNRWEILGLPNIVMEIPFMDAPNIICSSIVNRIPDVINAAPGFCTLDKMPSPMYRTQKPEYYIG